VNPNTRLAEDTLRRHFVAASQRPAGYVDLDLGRQPPSVRAAMVHDGTLSSLLEALRLQPVEVRVEQESLVPAGPRARWLGVAADDPVVHRTVALVSVVDGAPVADAQSWLVTDRLPGQLTRSLRQDVRGLGGALGALHLESRRELLWYGAVARGRPGAGAPVRCYRLIVGGRIAALVEERFPPAPDG
jgi:chorismate-pyruvate lyase